MVPLMGVPETIRCGLAPERDGCCRAEGCNPVSRSGTGLRLRPHQTLPGIHPLQVWAPDTPRRRRAMHAAVVEAGWATEALMPRPRQVVAGAHRGRGQAVISLD
jgi:hypothetical protein